MNVLRALPLTGRLVLRLTARLAGLRGNRRRAFVKNRILVVVEIAPSSRMGLGAKSVIEYCP
jgi:hypothetical protein